MEPEKDQPQPDPQVKPEESKEKAPESLFGKDGYWDRGMKFVEEADIAKDEDLGVKATEKKEEPCEGCDDEGKKPLFVIERKGEKIPVYDMEEAKKYAQQGYDYTKKTQELADDKKKFEGEVGNKLDIIQNLADKINLISEGRAKDLGIKEAKPEEEKSIEDVYEEYGIDEFSDPVQKKMLETIHGLNKQIVELTKSNKQNRDVIDLYSTRDAVNIIGEGMKEARKEFPFEEIIDEDGKNLTARQFVRMFKAKTDDPSNKGRHLGEIAKETVKDLYYLQQGSRKKTEQIPSGEDVKKMSVQDFVTRFPEIATKLKEQGVADHLAVERESPPDLRPNKREVDLSKVRGKNDQPQSLREYLDKAAKDPEIKFE